MSTARTGLSIGVIVALAVAIWAAVSSGNDEVPPTSSTSATVSSTSVSTSSSTTTTAPTTTSAATSVPGTTDPEARLEEVRLILEDLYFRWFDAIYRNDEEAALDVVATPERLDAFREAAANHQYPTEPLREQVAVRELEILLDVPDCLVAFSTLDLTGWLGEGMTSSAVDVLWSHGEESWRRASLWTNRNDLWESDCTAERGNELP
jgi:hypothetical protein